jgi:glyoxylase-like metal-dependent hydrolase (beta-lactamase superfamily II)
MQYIAPGLYTLEGLIVGRVYLIEDPDGLTIIDASITQSTNTVLKQITESKHKLTDIKRILLTHAHQDHIGALAELRKQSGAPIITSEFEKPIAEGATPTVVPHRLIHAPAVTFKGIKVDRTVNDGDMIESMGGLQVIATPGHSPGHISFWQPERKILFVGDAIMRLFGRLQLPLAMATPDMDKAKRSIAKIAKLDVQIACFGHGEPITQGTAELIRAFAKHVGAI